MSNPRLDEAVRIAVETLRDMARTEGSNANYAETAVEGGYWNLEVASHYDSVADELEAAYGTAQPSPRAERQAQEGVG